MDGGVRVRRPTGPVLLPTSSHLFEPDQLMPSQWRANCKRHFTPEQYLMLAVLEDAVMVYQRHVRLPDRTAQAIAEDEAEWFASDADYPCSFRFVCEAVGLDAAYIRRGLQAWIERGENAPRYKAPRFSGSYRRVAGRVTGQAPQRRSLFSPAWSD